MVERAAAQIEDAGPSRVTYYATGDTEAFRQTARMVGEAGDAVHAIEPGVAA